VLRKITLRIVPFIMLLYFIAFLDRVNIGFAALTMNNDLGFLLRYLVSAPGSSSSAIFSSKSLRT
jgi:hypothetical protein